MKKLLLVMAGNFEVKQEKPTTADKIRQGLVSLLIFIFLAVPPALIYFRVASAGYFNSVDILGIQYFYYDQKEIFAVGLAILSIAYFLIYSFLFNKFFGLSDKK